jgi:hypothetical protein
MYSEQLEQWISMKYKDNPIDGSSEKVNRRNFGNKNIVIVKINSSSNLFEVLENQFSSFNNFVAY